MLRRNVIQINSVQHNATPYCLQHYATKWSNRRNKSISPYDSLVQTHFDYCCEVWDLIDSKVNCRVGKIEQQELFTMGYLNEHGRSNAAMTAI